MKKRILIVDDDLFLCHMLEKMLSLSGYDVSSVHDGLEALDEIKQNTPDLILMDFLMPNQNGYETLQWLKGDLLMKPLPVVMMSGNVNDAVVQSFFEAGAIDFIDKGVLTSKGKLLTIISEALSA